MTIRASESSWSALTDYRSRAEGVDHGARCGLAKLQTVIDAACVLRTLMKDARGGLIR